MKTRALCLIWLALFLLPSAGGAGTVGGGSGGTDTPVTGVMGLTPVPAHSGVAVWVPLAEGEALSGLRW